MRYKRDSRISGDWQIDPLTDNRRPSNRDDRLIPMINVVFLLLTFFLISGTLRMNDALKIDPPEIATEGAIRTQSPILSVEANGTMTFDGSRVETNQVVEIIRKSLSDAPGGRLYVKADRDTPASVILPLLQTLRDGGLTAIRLIAVKKGE